MKSSCVLKLFFIFLCFRVVKLNPVNGNVKTKDDYYRLDNCKDTKFCSDAFWSHVLNGERNILNTQRSNDFFSMFNTESEDQHDSYYVYAIFDPVNFKSALDFVRTPTDSSATLSLSDFYNDDNIKLFESSIIYVGSGVHDRVRDHVVLSKSDCPEIDKGFKSTASATSQVAMFNCFTILNEESGTKQFVYAYHLIEVNTEAQSRTIEQALIRIFYNSLVNSEYSVEQAAGENEYFIAHFVLEYFFRALPFQIEAGKYSFQDLPNDQFSAISTATLYSDQLPKKVVFQGEFLYTFPKSFYNIPNKAQCVAPANIVVLPFKNDFDYELQTHQIENLRALILRLTKTVIEKTNDAALKCFETESNNHILGGSLKAAFKQLSIRLFCCLKQNPIEIKKCTDNDRCSKIQSLLGGSVYRKIMTTFQYKIAIVSYLREPSFIINWNQDSIDGTTKLEFVDDVDSDAKKEEKELLEFKMAVEEEEDDADLDDDDDDKDKIEHEDDKGDDKDDDGDDDDDGKNGDGGDGGGGGGNNNLKKASSSHQVCPIRQKNNNDNNNDDGGSSSADTTMQVSYSLYSSKNKEEPEKFRQGNLEQIRNLKGFKGNRKTVVIASGYKPSLKDQKKRSERSVVINNETLEESSLVFSRLSFDWQIAMKDSFLDNYDVNVIIIDWSTSGANSGLYWNAAKSTKQIGILVARQIKLLCQYQGTTEDKFHLIGHSLGAHLLGFTGKHLDGKIGQITGLDPAGLFFENKPRDSKLWYTDAKFVDVIHSDIKPHIGLGIIEPLGTIDYYPNGGKSQPGCKKERFSSFFNSFQDGLTTLISCEHSRAYLIYLDAITASKRAYQCENYYDYKHNYCNYCGKDDEMCPFVGPKAAEFNHQGKHHIKAYFKTNDQAPYL